MTLTDEQVRKLQDCVREMAGIFPPQGIRVGADPDTQQVLLDIMGVSMAALTPRQANELAFNLRKYARIAIGREV